MKILFSSNISWSVYNFRLRLLQSLQKEGHEIYVAAKEDAYSIKLKREHNINFIPVKINNNGTNPFLDVKLVYNYIKIFKKIKPDLILQNAIKPNIYGTIAAKFLKIPTINNISGLGTLFIRKSTSTALAKFLYEFSQKYASVVFFQNDDDRNLFVQNDLINKQKTKLIPGSGVNIRRFSPKINSNSENKKFEFLFIGRLIYDKGIKEYVDAAILLKKKYKKITFSVLGPFYTANRTSVESELFKQWTSSNIINYLGKTDVVENEIAHADCIVLPSYREGLSKVLLEASSMEKPIVTTNVPGCRDVVIDGYNGYLSKVKDSEDLAIQMEKLYLLNNEERKQMGVNARQRVVKYFDEKIIIDIYKREINKIFASCNVKEAKKNISIS